MLSTAVIDCMHKRRRSLRMSIISSWEVSPENGSAGRTDAVFKAVSALQPYEDATSSHEVPLAPPAIGTSSICDELMGASGCRHSLVNEHEFSVDEDAF